MRYVIALLLVCVCAGIVGCDPLPAVPSTGTPAVATSAPAPEAPSSASIIAAAHAALRASKTADGKSLDSYVGEITVQSGGAVIVTLNQTSAALAPTSGKTGAEQIGAAFGAIVLDKVPGVSSVSVFDANNVMLELSTRP